MLMWQIPGGSTLEANLVALLSDGYGLRVWRDPSEHDLPWTVALGGQIAWFGVTGGTVVVEEPEGLGFQDVIAHEFRLRERVGGTGRPGSVRVEFAAADMLPASQLRVPVQLRIGA